MIDRSPADDALVLGEFVRRALRIDLTDDLASAVEHHLELAQNRDELPAFFRTSKGVGGRENVESTRQVFGA